MSSDDLGEWKLHVVSELVWAALPEAPEDAKPWDDIAVRAVYEYERDKEKWQQGDPKFDLYQDNFIAKGYIFNHRAAIRGVLAQQGRTINWHAGRGRGEIWREESVSAMETVLHRQQMRVEGMAEGYNTMNETARKAMPEVNSPYLQIARLTAGTQDN